MTTDLKTRGVRILHKMHVQPQLFTTIFSYVQRVIHNEIYELLKTFLQTIMASRILDTDSLKNHMIWLKRKVQVFNKNLAENSESTVPNQTEETQPTHGSDQDQSHRTLIQGHSGDNLLGFEGQRSSEIGSSESERQGVFGNEEETTRSSIFGARPLQSSLQSNSSVFSAPTLTDIISINDDSFKLPRYQRELYEKKTKSSRLRQLVSEHRENKGSDFDDGTEKILASPELPDQKRPKYTFVPGAYLSGIHVFFSMQEILAPFNFNWLKLNFENSHSWLKFSSSFSILTKHDFISGPPPTSCNGSLDQEMLDSKSNLGKNSGTPHSQTDISTKTSAAIRETTVLSPRMRCADYLIPKPGPNENVDDWIRGMELLLGLSVDSRLSDVTETDVEASYENPFQHSRCVHDSVQV